MIQARKILMCLLTAVAVCLSGFHDARADLMPFSRWEVNISFAAGGGSGRMASVTKTYTDNGKSQYYTLPSCKFTRAGYTFAGWVVQDSCTDSAVKVYPRGYSYELCGGDLTVTATWKLNAKTHVTTLFRNNSSGDGAGARRTVVEGTYYTLPTISSLGWTRSGYTFKGWATSRYATTVTYSDGASVYVSSSLTSLYAVWEDNTHVMTLYRNNSSGDGAGARRKVPSGGYYTLPTISSLGWARSGYTFKGWATYRGATYADYNDGEQIYVDSGLSSLYAVWADYWQGRSPAVIASDPTPDFTADDMKFVEVYGDQIVPIILEANGGVGDPYLVRVRTYWDGDMDGYTLPECPFVRSGYKFVGWEVYNGCYVGDTYYVYTRGGVDCGGGYIGTYQPGFFYYVCAPTVLRAKWAEESGMKTETYIVRLHRNNDEYDGATAGRTYTVGRSRILPTMAALNWTRDGYEFLGWSERRGDMVVKYVDGQNINPAGAAGSTVHLYAVWRGYAYTVRLHRNNSVNDGATAGRAFVCGKIRFLPTVAELKWTRPGYLFMGWSASQSSSTVKFADGLNAYDLLLSPVDGDTLHLWGVWKKSNSAYLLRLHRNNDPRDGATAGLQLTLNISRSLPTIDSLGWSRPGYAFVGWAYYPGASSYDVYYRDGESVYNLSDYSGDTVHIYAVWQEL